MSTTQAPVRHRRTNRPAPYRPRRSGSPTASRSRSSSAPSRCSLLAMWLVPGILTIVLGGVGLALVLSHPVGWLCRLMPRGLAILVALLLLLGGIALALAVLIPLLIDQLTELIATWPNLQTTLVQLLDEATQGLRTRGLLPEEGASLTDRDPRGPECPGANDRHRRCWADCSTWRVEPRGSRSRCSRSCSSRFTCWSMSARCATHSSVSRRSDTARTPRRCGTPSRPRWRAT